jgi:hypothetical protein
MDKPFLQLMSKSYVNDTSLNLNVDEVYSYIDLAFESFKKTFPDYLNDLYESSRSYQQDLIYIILDNKFNPDIIEEGLVEELSFANIKRGFKVMLAKSMSPEMEFLSGVIEKNHNNCNQTCVPSNTRIHNDQLVALLNTSGKFNNERMFTRILNAFTNKSSEESDPKLIYKVSKCIRMCYLDYLTSVYAEGIVNYEKCLTELNPGNSQNSFNSYTDILRSHPMGDECVHIFTYLNELFADINKLLDIVYKRDSIRKRSWLNVIDEKSRAFRTGRKYVIDFSKIDDEYENPNDYVRVV